MAGTEYAILAVCPLHGKQLDTFIKERFGDNKRSINCGPVIDRLTREAGWIPEDHTECRQGVSVWHNVNRDGTDYCVKVTLPDGQEGYVFSYDWDYHNDDSGILYLIQATDDEFVLTGFHTTDAEVEVTYAENDTVNSLYCNPELVQGTLRTVSFDEKGDWKSDAILSNREWIYIRNAAENIRKNYSKNTRIIFTKMISLPPEAFE